MSDERIRNLERRLQKLKDQKAYFGVRTSPEILMEIEDIEAELTRLKAKEDPWETLAISKIMLSLGGIVVEILIKGDLSTFTEQQKSKVLKVLAVQLDCPLDMIKILDIRQGSIIMKMAMPTNAAKRLLASVEAKDAFLQELGIKYVKIIHSYDNSEIWYKACQSTNRAIVNDAYQQLGQYLYPKVFYYVRDQNDAESLAQECVQEALERVYLKINTVKSPLAFCGWAKRIALNKATTKLRKRGIIPTPVPLDLIPDEAISLLKQALQKMEAEEIRHHLKISPISERSYRVITGRYFEGKNNKELALIETELMRTEDEEANLVLASHIAVTRAKNFAKLKASPLWQKLLQDIINS